MPRRFSTPVQLPGNPTGALEAAPKQYVDAQSALKADLTGATFSGLLTAARANFYDLAWAQKQTADVKNRYEIFTDGYTKWGTGAVDPDTWLFRSGPAVLETNGVIKSNGSELATKSYVETFVPRSPYPLTAYGLLAASIHPDNVSSLANGITVNTIEINRIWLPPNMIVSGAACLVTTAGTTSSTNTSGFALYSDAGALLTNTANDYTLFTTAGMRSKAFGSSISSGASGAWYRLAILHSCTGTAPKFATGPSLGAALQNSVAGGGSHRRVVFQTGVTSWPASFTPSTYGTNDSFVYLVGVY